MLRRTALLTVILVAAATAALWWATRWQPVLLYLAVINVVAAGYVAIDKALAGSGAWRFPEALLLGTALAGGSPLAWVAMRAVRHKTSKASYRARFTVVVVIQTLLIGALCVWLLRS
jgi:uncharacterized membrane protein YsdA (DUF1294 family)